jgi:ABC-type lipoprotein export system ATPase subunit
MATRKMTTADEIAQAPSGARFVRADLHIHSYGASHDVTDHTFTPENIVQQAVRENLRLVAIADHNETGNVGAAIKFAVGTGVTVIPGIELSTPQGHLLAYFESLESLRTFHGGLQLADRDTPKSRCQTAMLDCLNKVHGLKGFAILAHVDGAGGLESIVSGYPPHKADIICHPALVGIELQSAQSTISFSDSDPVPERVAFAQQRIQKLKLGQRQFLARVLFSDSHSLAAMGKNAAGNRRVTRMKMDSPSFEGVRIALQDADARIRLEDEIPDSVPYLMGMKIEGGFLDGQIIHFSRNLNCIIGGRGAGKSTALEAARVLSSIPSSNRLIDSEVWPDVLQLVWVDESGQQHTIRRRHGDSSENLGDSVFGPTEFPMECYGQNETAQTSDRAEKDPGVLLKYLDQFTGVAALHIQDDGFRDRLLANQSEIEKAQQQVNLIPEYKKLLTNTRQQLKTLESANAKDVIALERKVAEERTIRATIESSLADITNDVKSSTLPEVIAEIYGLSEPDQLKIGPKEFEQILSDLKTFEKKVTTARSAIATDAKMLAASVKKQLESWKAHEKKITDEIEQKKKELLDKGIKLDSQYIKKLAGDESRYKKDLDTLNAWEKKLKELILIRTELVKQRLKNRVAILNQRIGYSIKANSALRNTLGDLSVDVKFLEGALSQDAESIITEAMGWRTSQVPKAALLVEQVTVPGLVSALTKNDPAPIVKVTASDGSKPFSISDAQEMITALSAAPVRFRIERCMFEDKPRITVTKRIAESGKSPRFVSKDFSRLSLGQQQSVLLALMLSSDSRYPLVIDQPEDNLDSEFIFHSLVPVLRAAKERRQIIVVTHNPNIGVLGDAEKILAFKSTSDKSVVVADGSIDDPKTRDVVCQILEGAEEAFRRRAKIYGVL